MHFYFFFLEIFPVYAFGGGFAYAEADRLPAFQLATASIAGPGGSSDPIKPIEVRKEFPQVWLWANSTNIKFVIFYRIIYVYYCACALFQFECYFK